MASRPRAALASVIGWVIVVLIAIWAFGLLIGWIRFLLRSFLWLVLIVVLLVAYFAVKGPPEE